ncbi:TdeIII family type II restriction endonuclease [bacterium]|nr:TdeIII family type II restriction endonuclease [bacterium]
MSISLKQQQIIKSYLTEKIRNKLNNYNPETHSMPFHYRLLGKNRMALFSFIHSVNTMLGTSIFEKVGELILSNRAQEVKSQYKDLVGYISEKAVICIDTIMRDLKSTRRTPCKFKETKEVIAVAKQGNLGDKIKKRVDIYAKMDDDTEYYFELKSAKPNINEFTGIKKQLLDWVAIRGSISQPIKIKTILAIPYNPYEPEPYQRWTLQGLFDLENEVLVGKEFWDFLGGSNTYEDLLNVFENAGLELYDEIDEKMKNL